MKIVVRGLFSLGERWRSRLKSFAVASGLAPPNRRLKWKLVPKTQGLLGWMAGVAE